MIKNYLTMAWRSLLRNKLHGFINILGLAIGVSACLVIYLIVDYELSFNKKIENQDRIYRISSSFTGSFSGLNRGVPSATGAVVRDEFTGIESTAFFHTFSSTVTIPTATENKKLERQEGIIFTDSAFFHVFKPFEWIAGSPEVLAQPHHVVLTESRAKIYFGTSDPAIIIGKEVIYQDSLSTSVAGIVKDLPFNTDIDMTNFISLSTIDNSWMKNRIRLDEYASTNSSSQLFVLLDKTHGVEKLNEQLPILSKKYKENSRGDAENKFNAQPLSDIHFNAEIGIFDYSRSPADKSTLTILTVVAILLLIIAAINFINLETAQAVRRAKEVGVRKTLGSSQSALVTQFLSQSFIITALAIVLAIPLAEIALRIFSDFVPAGVHLSIIEILPFLLLVITLVGLVAGLYPAFVLSSFLPALVLKGQSFANSKTTRSAYLRKTLIVFQFSIAQVLIIAALVVGWQIDFMINTDIGFNKDAAIYFYAPWTEKASKVEVLKNELSKLSEVAALSLSEQPPSFNGWSSSTAEYKPEKGDVVKVNAFRKYGDTQYISFYDIKLLAGRNLQPIDSLRELIINRTMLNQLGFKKPDDALGEVVSFNRTDHSIIGVVEDFHIQSLHKKVEPVIIGYREGFQCFNIRISTPQGTSDFKKGLESIETSWKKVYPDSKIEFKFLDETLKNFYQSEQRTSKLVQTATAMAIFISCLGLFGLVSFTTTQRTKEIGIRKVLGSSVRNIVLMLSKDFILLVVIAFVIATPVAWIIVNRWLEGFAYHMTLNAWIFMITALAGVTIAFTTVAYQTLKAATSNPVDSLRNE